MPPIVFIKSILVQQNTMTLTNNKTSIIQNWINKWYQTGWLGFAQWVENATGNYPDSPIYQSENEKSEITEDELIQDSLINPNHIY